MGGRKHLPLKMDVSDQSGRAGISVTPPPPPPPPLPSITALFYGYFKKLLQATWKKKNWKEKFEVTSGNRIGTYCAKGCTLTNCDNPSS